MKEKTARRWYAAERLYQKLLEEGAEGLKWGPHVHGEDCTPVSVIGLLCDEDTHVQLLIPENLGGGYVAGYIGLYNCRSGKPANGTGNHYMYKGGSSALGTNLANLLNKLEQAR